MPSASMSQYIRKVVNGVRSSWVTAEAKRARRWAKAMEAPSERLAATTARPTASQVSTKVIRAGVTSGIGPSAGVRVTNNTGIVARS